MNENIALARAHDVTLDLLQRTARWPKRLRYGLTGRVEAAAVEMLGLLAKAQTARGGARADRLRGADAALAELRVLLRLATDLGFVSAGGEAYLAERLDEVGRLVGGWLRSTRGPKQADSPRAVPAPV